MMKTLLFAVALLLSLSGSAQAAEKVRLQLNWVPEAEFGGIYEAQRSGAFAKYGLDVEIAAGGAGTPTWQLVASGKTPYAIASADEVIVARAKGADVVALFAIYQTCPQGIMCHAERGFDSLEALLKSPGTLAAEPGLPYVSYLRQRYGMEKIRLVAYDGGIGSFLRDKNLAQQCFITSEPLAARKAGADARVFLIADSGYNPYTAVVIARSADVASNPAQAKSLIAALREGWRAYLDDPAPANELMAKLNPDMPAATMAAAAEAQKKLIETDETRKTGLGSMTLARWETLAKQLVELKVIDAAPPAGDCFKSFE